MSGLIPSVLLNNTKWCQDFVGYTYRKEGNKVVTIKSILKLNNLKITKPIFENAFNSLCVTIKKDEKIFEDYNEKSLSKIQQQKHDKLKHNFLNNDFDKFELIYLDEIIEDFDLVRVEIIQKGGTNFLFEIEIGYQNLPLH